eukprot:1733773-Heterocapsa_arctica.AAC.1
MAACSEMIRLPSPGPVPAPTAAPGPSDAELAFANTLGTATPLPWPPLMPSKKLLPKERWSVPMTSSSSWMSESV